MSGRGPQCWLVGSGGGRIRVPLGGGVLLGRGVECDVVLRDRGASRVQAIISFDGHAAYLFSVGRNPNYVGGDPVEARTRLSSGTELSLPGEDLSVVIDDHEGGRGRLWALEHRGGVLLGLSSQAVSVGGGRDDHLRLEGMVPAAARFHVISGALVVVLQTAAKINGELQEAGYVDELEVDAEIAIGSHTFIARAEGAQIDPTVDQRRRMETITFSFLPVGGKLDFEVGGETTSVELSELRGRLVAILLSPPAGYEPGEFIPDEDVLSAIWPGDDTKGRLDLNTLVHRVRKSLLQAGLNPTQVLQRARNGGGTRFRVPPGATVNVE